MIYHQFKYVLKFCNCSIETIFCDDQTLKISWNHRGMKPCRFLFFSCSPIPKLRIRISQVFFWPITDLKYIFLSNTCYWLIDSWKFTIHGFGIDVGSTEQNIYACRWKKQQMKKIFYSTFYGHFLHKYGTKVRWVLIF